jgi:hypothetical protein
MNWIIAAFAALAAVIGGILLWIRIRAGKELGVMQATETSRARDVAAKQPGSLVELKGTLRAPELLTAEFSGRPCVYYRALVEREVERVTTNADGKRDTRRAFETVSSNERHAPATLEDGTGSVPVRFEGARVEAIQVHRRYEAEGGVATLVGDLLNVGGMTRGHRYSEWIIPADAPVYVLGSVLADGAVGASPGKKTPFVISHKSEEERAKSLTSTRLWQLIGAVVCFAAAIGLLVWAVG